MTTDLDQRIRRTVIEVVDTAPAPPPFDELTVPEPQPRRPVRRIVTVAIAAVTVVALAIGAALFIRDGHSSIRPAAPIRDGIAQFALDSIPKGVSAQSLQGTPVFFVRHGDRVTTLLTHVQHLPGEQVLWWCPRERLFRSPTHGETFNEKGHVVGGPARYGLDRLATRVRAGKVHVNLRRVKGDSEPRQQYEYPPGNVRFCERALKNGRFSNRVVRIEALPTLKFDADRYEVPAGVVDLRFIDRGGSHLLRFERASLKRFELQVPNGPNRVKVRLDPGEYVVYCGVPGHRAAGMQATIVVTPK